MFKLNRATSAFINRRFLIGTRLANGKNEQLLVSNETEKNKINTERFRNELPLLKEKNANPGPFIRAEKNPQFYLLENGEEDDHEFGKLTNIRGKLPEMKPPEVLNSALPTLEEFEQMMEQIKKSQQMDNSKNTEDSGPKNEKECLELSKTPPQLGTLEDKGVFEERCVSENKFIPEGICISDEGSISVENLALVSLPIKLHRNDGNLLTDELVQNLENFYLKTLETLSDFYTSANQHGIILWHVMACYLIEKQLSYGLFKDSPVVKQIIDNIDKMKSKSLFESQEETDDQIKEAKERTKHNIGKD